MSRFLLCGGDFCAFNLGFLADPCNVVPEIGCCNRGVGESGFGWHSTAHEVCATLGKRLDGKLVIITGANSGVGLEAAKALFEVGATVVLACRSAPRAAAAIKQIEDTADLSGQPGKLVFAELDLGSLRSVEACARAVIAMPEPLHALICNGGIMAVPFSLTGDGHETQFQVNYLSHYHLTTLLLDKLKAAGQSRIVNVSSVSHAWVPFPGGCCGSCCSLCFGGFDLSGRRFPAKSGGCCAYEPFEDYAYSKAAQVIMTSELNRRLVQEGSGVAVVALEPGLSAESGIVNGSGCLRCMVNYTCVGSLMGAILGKTLPQMASTVVYAALGDDVKGGDFLRNVNKARPVGPAGDPAHGPPLWALSAKAVANVAAGPQVVPPRAAAMN